MAGASIMFFAYIGFDAVSTAAEETINPKRDVPRGLAICLGVVIVLYVTVAVVITGMVPFKEISQNNAIPGALARFGINWGAALVGTGAVIGMISTLLVMLYGQIRVFMVMSRDGLLPKVFSKVTPSSQNTYSLHNNYRYYSCYNGRIFTFRGDNKTMQYRYIICLHSCFYWCYST